MSEPLRLWSVTTLIKLGLGTSEPLVNWAVGTTAAAAYDRYPILRQFVDDGDRDGAIDWLKRVRYQKSGVAMARGTDLHRAAEQMALGQEPTIEPDNMPYLDQYRKFLAEHQPVFEMAEAPVYHPKAGYAGTCDGVMALGGQRVVFDYKTTDRPPDSDKARPPYSEVALQLCGYRRALEVGALSEQRYAGNKRYYLYDPEEAHEPMPETDGAVCVVISPFDYQVVPVRTDDSVWRALLHVIECARWQVETSRGVIGRPVAPPSRMEEVA